MWPSTGATHDNIFNGFPLTRCTRIPLAVIRSYFWMVALPLLGYTVAAGGGQPAPHGSPRSALSLRPDGIGPHGRTR
jgi:hypothetical protein